MTASFVRALERFLLPNACVACGRAVEPHRPDALVCGVCQTRLRPLAPGGCTRCRQPLPPVGPCRFCAAWPAALVEVRSAVWLDPTARAMVHHFKYSNYPAIGLHMADAMARHLPTPKAGAVIPIPLGDRRRRARGYNQAAVLARHLADTWQLPLLERALLRKRETGTQTALTPAERAENMRGAFVAASDREMKGGGGGEGRDAATRAPSPPPSISPSGEGRGRAVILIDDVLTTGATLGAATVALEAAGWGPVTAATFARALPFEMRAT